MTASETAQSLLASIARDLEGLLHAVRAGDTKPQLMIHIGGLMVEVTALTAALSDQAGGWQDILAEIAAERKRQVEVEGYDAAHDDEHHKGEIARAAACYAYLAGAESDWLREELKKEWWGPLHSRLKQMWPWEWFYLKPKGRRNELICSAALSIAEIERIDRAMIAAAPPPSSTAGEG